MDLDLATVVKMSQAVSEEIVLDRLIERLLVIAVEHAGAVRGLLVLPDGNDLRIEAEATTGGEGVLVFLRRAFATAGEIPESIFRYVMRTQESVILDDAATPNVFSTDVYVRGKRPRSVLCLPLVKQARLIGVLYLENDLTSHVFTPPRIAVLKLLASQAAISLENARLFNDVNKRRKRRNKVSGNFDWRSTRCLRSHGTLWPTARTRPSTSNGTILRACHPRKRSEDGGSPPFTPTTSKISDTWMRHLVSGGSSEIEARMRRFDGEYRWFLLRASPMLDEQGNVIKWYGTNSDIDDLKRAEALQAGEKRLFEMIATGHSLPEILDALCRIVEDLNGGSLTSILLLDETGKFLRTGAAPNLPDAYSKAIDGILIGPSAGSCGTAAYRREKVLVSDIADRPALGRLP